MREHQDYDIVDAGAYGVANDVTAALYISSLFEFRVIWLRLSTGNGSHTDK